MYGGGDRYYVRRRCTEPNGCASGGSDRRMQLYFEHARHFKTAFCDLAWAGWVGLAGRPVLVFIISAAPRTQLHLCTNNARKTLGVYGSRASAPPQSRIGFPSGRPLLAASCGSRGLQVRARVRNLRARVALLEHCAATSGPPRPGIAVLCLSTATYLQTTHPLPACCSPCPSQGC